MRKKILICGSRVASPRMKAYARSCVRRALDIGAEIIVGDALGIDATVIAMADALNIPVKVFGGYSRMRQKTERGENIPLDGDFLARDRYMVDQCGRNDAIICVWNGVSKGTRHTYDYALSKGLAPTLKEFALEESRA